MARAGFQSGPGSARPTSQSRGCSHKWGLVSFSWGLSGWRWANIPEKTHSTRWSKSRRQMFLLQELEPFAKIPVSLALNLQAGASLLLPVPHWSCPADEWIIHSLGDLHLHPRPWKFQSRVGKVMPPHIPKSILLHRNPWRSASPKTGRRSRSGLTLEKIWAVILPCPWDWPPS